MKIAAIVIQIALLYVFYMIGAWLQQLFNLPVPGSIVGLILLFVTMNLKIFSVKWVASGAGFLLSYLPLLFIPATMGVMNYFHLFTGNGVLLIFVVSGSTLITMVAAGHTSQYVANRAEKRKEKKTCQSRYSQSS